MQIGDLTDHMRGVEMRGSIIRLVTSYGTRWGRVQPSGKTRQIFFNSSALPESVDFLSLRVGQTVEFRERKDEVNGTHAEEVVLVRRPPGKPR